MFYFYIHLIWLLIGFFGYLTPINEALILPLLFKKRTGNGSKILPLLLPYIPLLHLPEIKRLQTGHYPFLNYQTGMTDLQLLNLGFPETFNDLPLHSYLIKLYCCDHSFYLLALLLPFLLGYFNEQFPSVEQVQKQFEVSLWSIQVFRGGFWGEVRVKCERGRWVRWVRKGEKEVIGGGVGFVWMIQGLKSGQSCFVKVFYKEIHVFVQF